jgi:hypothetical protein
MAERDHGDQMATLGALNALLKVKIKLNEDINDLNVILEKDKANKAKNSDKPQLKGNN